MDDQDDVEAESDRLLNVINICYKGRILRLFRSVALRVKWKYREILRTT